MQIVEIETGGCLGACRKALFCFLNSVILYIDCINMLFLHRRRMPEAVPEAAFRDAKDRLWHHERPSLTRLLSVCTVAFERKWLI